MVPAHLIHRFASRQKRLLRSTYDQAWQAGVANYQPDADPPHDDRSREQHPNPITVAASGAAVLLAKRALRYRPPGEPDGVRRARALVKATRSVDRMTAELATLHPGQEHYAAADAALTAGTITPEQVNAYALAQAVGGWTQENAFRLELGDSVAWAGEQDGYAQAASQDGMLLGWQTEDDDGVCPDCDSLGQLPPMPQDDWPSTPGDGSTECNVGCRCSLEATDELNDGDTLYPLDDQDQAVLDRVTGARETVLAADTSL